MKLETVLRELVTMRKQTADARAAYIASLPDKHADKHFHHKPNALGLVGAAATPEYQFAITRLIEAGVLVDAGFDTSLRSGSVYVVRFRPDRNICVAGEDWRETLDADWRAALVWVCAATKPQGAGTGTDKEYGEAKLRMLQAELDAYCRDLAIVPETVVLDGTALGRPVLQDVVMPETPVVRGLPSTPTQIQEVAALWARVEAGEIDYNVVRPIIDRDATWEVDIAKAVQRGCAETDVRWVVGELRRKSVITRSTRIDISSAYEDPYYQVLSSLTCDDGASHTPIVDCTMSTEPSTTPVRIKCTLRPNVPYVRHLLPHVDA